MTTAPSPLTFPASVAQTLDAAVTILRRRHLFFACPTLETHSEASLDH